MVAAVAGLARQALAMVGHAADIAAGWNTVHPRPCWPGHSRWEGSAAERFVRRGCCAADEVIVR